MTTDQIKDVLNWDATEKREEVTTLLLHIVSAAEELAVLCREEFGQDKPEITHVYWLLKKLKELK